MRNVFKFLIAFFCLFACLHSYADTPKKWTFLIFLNGKNSLDDFGIENIKSMEKVGSNDQVNIVVEWGSMATGKTVRMLIQKSTDSSQITSKIVEDMGSVDMGNYKSLEDFIEWGAKNYPADKYFINVWNHGGGWHLKKTKNPKLLHDISWDELTGNCITTEQLGEVMAFAKKVFGHNVDIYGSDACLMGMAEVADQMSQSVDYFVGSQETEPGAGWPYEDLLKQWEAIPNPTSKQVANIIVDTYVKSYENGSNGTSEVTFSAYDLSKLSSFNQAISKLGENLRELNPSEREKVLKVLSTVQSFAFSDYVDLLDLVNKLSAANIHGLKPTVIAEAKLATNALIIANQDTPGFANAHGLSIWFPADSDTYNNYADRYQHLQFNIDTQWNDTLGYLLQGA